MLLIQRLPMAREVAAPLVQNLNNRERADWLRGLAAADERDPAVTELYAHAILCFDICVDNRNMLIHALYEGTDAVTAKMKLTKKARNDPLREIKFQVSLEELRKAAVEMGNTVNFMIELYGYMRARRSRDQYGVPAILPPLPQKRARPDRLTIPPPPEDGTT